VSKVAPINHIDGTLLLSLHGDLEDATMLRIEDELTREVARTQVKGALIDVSGLTVVDSFVVQILARAIAMIRLLGAQAVVVGIQPAVAITLAELGVPIGGIPTALTAGHGMTLLRRLRSDATRGR
jgi:rsbT antagonist protein RsbS